MRSVLFNIRGAYRWINIRGAYRWLNIRAAYRWLNIRAAYRWLNIRAAYQWFIKLFFLPCGGRIHPWSFTFTLCIYLLLTLTSKLRQIGTYVLITEQWKFCILKCTLCSLVTFWLCKSDRSVQEFVLNDSHLHSLDNIFCNDWVLCELDTLSTQVPN